MRQKATSLPPLISAMAEPHFYPHRPDRVELRQTHISYVFLAGEYVYKVKKPVRFTFLDYSTLEKRYRFCQEEVRLNRRLAPKVYLGVGPLIEREGEFFVGEGAVSPGQWRIVEYAVKMRRLPEERMLDRLVAEGQVERAAMEVLAQKLFSFHLASAADRAPLYGTPEVIWQALFNNFQETEPFVGQTLSPKTFNFLEEYSCRFLAEHRQLFYARIQAERVREGHGDLRSEHICLADEPVIFDCIEFSERLRYCDVASEIAFLAMDLDFLGVPALSQELVQAYQSLAEDEDFFLLLPFYQCYRAYVRGKVESLKSQEEEVPGRERERAHFLAQRYFQLATRYARGTPPPALILVCGLAGTGKSTLARLLADRTGFAVLSSDLVRKRLARLPPTARATSEYRTHLYSDSFTCRTYQTLLAEAERALGEGRGVVVDATFKDPEHRRLFLQLAERAGVPLLFVECQAEEEEIFRRLKKREGQEEEVSDATWEIYLRQREEFVPLSEIPAPCYLPVRSVFHMPEGIEGDLEEILARVTVRG